MNEFGFLIRVKCATLEKQLYLCYRSINRFADWIVRIRNVFRKRGCKSRNTCGYTSVYTSIRVIGRIPKHCAHTLPIHTNTCRIHANTRCYICILAAEEECSIAKWNTFSQIHFVRPRRIHFKYGVIHVSVTIRSQYTHNTNGIQSILNCSKYT